MNRVAIDLGRRESQICVRGADGTILEEKRHATRSLDRLMKQWPPSRVIVETSAEAFRIADAAKSAGHEVRVVPATLVKTLCASQNLAQTLAACAHVQVMAPAALQGQPRVLPAGVPWSYATSARGRASLSHQPTEGRPLIVTDVTPPAYLQLPLLRGYPQKWNVAGIALGCTRIDRSGEERRELRLDVRACVLRRGRGAEGDFRDCHACCVGPPRTSAFSLSTSVDRALHE